jgi:hypothetical protein
LLFFGASIYTLVGVSVEQYCAVVHPLSLQKRHGSPMKQGLIRAVVIWIAAAVAVVPTEVLVIHDGKRSATDANGMMLH